MSTLVRKAIVLTLSKVQKCQKIVEFHKVSKETTMDREWQSSTTQHSRSLICKIIHMHLPKDKKLTLRFSLKYKRKSKNINGDNCLKH